MLREQKWEGWNVFQVPLFPFTGGAMKPVMNSFTSLCGKAASLKPEQVKVELWVMPLDASPPPLPRPEGLFLFPFAAALLLVKV